MAGPLSGLVVADFSQLAQGPFAPQILGAMGAEVIKVEPPGGEPGRASGLQPDGFSSYFEGHNRGKKSIVLDITTPEGRETAARLADQCDVVLENFRPGLMAGFGLDYETLSERHPALIYVSHKGFLPGPYERRLALDEVVQMMGGLAYMTGPPGRPLRAGSSVVDITGGMFGASEDPLHALVLGLAVAWRLVRSCASRSSDRIEVARGS